MTDSFIEVCPVDQVKPGTALKVTVGDSVVALVKNSAGGIFAIGDRCSHGEISLSEGFVEGCELECWAHGAKFDLNSGWPTTLPAYEPVPVFHTEIRDGVIFINPTGELQPKP